MRSSTNSVPLDVERVEALVARRLRGDKDAHSELISRLCAFLLPTLSHSRLLARLDEDAPHEVMMRVLDKLEREEGRALAGYQDWRLRHPTKSVHDWLMIVLTNAAREYARAARGGRSGAGPSRARIMNELVELTEANEPGTRPPMTPLQTARAIVEYARAQLPQGQLECLERWLQGEEFDEISVALKLATSADAQRQLRAAIATLRRRYLEGATRKATR